MRGENPFVVGRAVPLDRFVGRRRQLITAFNQIRNCSNLALWGGQGLGKSSFLALLNSPQVWEQYGSDIERPITILVRCLAIEPFTPAGFWQQVSTQLAARLDELPELRTKVAALLNRRPPSKEIVRQIIAQLGRENKCLVLLIDDYDVALRSNPQYSNADIDAFVSECRTLAYSDDERQYLSAIVTSSRRLNEIGPRLSPNRSPWYNHYLFQPLYPFTDEEVDLLLSGVPMTSQWKAGIRAIADGNPALLQNAGYLLYDYFQDRRMPDPGIFAREFQTATQQFFQASWERSTESEQTLLMLLAIANLEGRLESKRYDISGINALFSQHAIELNGLVERGVIKHVGLVEEANYVFASSIMEWWVVNQIKNSNETELQQRRKGFLNLMSHKQADRFSTAIRWVWQHRESVPPSVWERVGRWFQ